MRAIPVDVHLMTLRASPSPADWALLDGSERERARAFRLPHLTDLFVLAHAATRRLLADRVGTAPEALHIERSCRLCGDARHGKPRVEGERVRFNLSHAGDRAMLALADGDEVGADIEVLDRARPVDDLAGYALSEAERARLVSADRVERTREFMSLWTVKEAHLKCSGTGLTVELRSVDAIGLLDRGQAVLLPGRDAYVAAVAVPDGHRVSVASVRHHAF